MQSIGTFIFVFVVVYGGLTLYDGLQAHCS